MWNTSYYKNPLIKRISSSFFQHTTVSFIRLITTLRHTITKVTRMDTLFIVTLKLTFKILKMNLIWMPNILYSSLFRTQTWMTDETWTTTWLIRTITTIVLWITTPPKWNTLVSFRTNEVSAIKQWWKIKLGNYIQTAILYHFNPLSLNIPWAVADARCAIFSKVIIFRTATCALFPTGLQQA